MEQQRRFIGIDLGKKEYELKIIHPNKKVTGWKGQNNRSGREALYKKLLPTDRVAIEVCSLSMLMAREMREKVGCDVVLLNPWRLAIIYRSVKKNDKEDALKLARMVQKYDDEELCDVKLPTEHEENLRQILAEIRQLKNDRTKEINRLHAIFLANGFTDIVRKDVASKENREHNIELLRSIPRLQAQRGLERIDLIESQLKSVTNILEEEIKGDKNIERLMNVPGVGKQTAAAFVSCIGDGSRFQNASKVGAAIGLVPRIDISSKQVIYGHITKRGNGNLRALLIMAAWSHIRSKEGGALKEKFAYMTQCQSKSKKIAIVAIARKLAELLYTLLKYGRDYEKRTSVATEKIAAEALIA